MIMPLTGTFMSLASAQRLSSQPEFSRKPAISSSSAAFVSAPTRLICSTLLTMALPSSTLPSPTPAALRNSLSERSLL